MTRLSQPCDKVVQHTHNLVKDKIKAHNEFSYLSVRHTYTKLKAYIKGGRIGGQGAIAPHFLRFVN